MTDLFEALYPSLSSFPKDFEILYRGLEPGQTSSWRGIQISAQEVDHYSGSPSLALSISDGAKRFAFSGDSGWCEGVIKAGREPIFISLNAQRSAQRPPCISII